jgi:hypothetical protein
MAVLYSLKCWDKSEWEFGEPNRQPDNGPHVRLARTPSGITGGTFEPVDRANRGQAGVTWFGQDDGPTIHTLDVHFGPMPPGDEAVSYYFAWLKALGRGRKVNEFYIDSGNGGRRFQQVRQMGEAAPSDEVVSLLWNVGYARETFQLRSDETWFRQKPKTRIFAPADFAGAKIPNRGDVSSWPKFTVHGPITNPVLGIAGESVTVKLKTGANLVIADGTKYTFQTDPEFAYIWNNDNEDIWWNLDVHGWYVKAPELTPRGVPLTLGGTSTGANTKIEVELPQLFHYGAA